MEQTGTVGVKNNKPDSCRNGFAMMEIILTVVIIGIIAANIMFLQNSSWKTSGSSNRLLLAGQMIDRQVESLRMQIELNPEVNFPPDDGAIRENGITLTWKITEAERPVGAGETLDNVRTCLLTAGWGTAKWDSLKVITYLAKNF